MSIARKKKQAGAASGSWSMRVKFARKLLGMKTQGELAKALGATQASVSQWESGNKRPSAEFFLKIGNLLSGRWMSDAQWFWAQSGLVPEVTAATEREQSLTSKIAQLQNEVEDYSLKLGTLDRSFKALQQRASDLEEKRRELLPAARAEGNKGAQRRLDRISKELEHAQKAKNEDAEALAVTKQKLERLNAELTLAEKEKQREHVRRLILERLNMLGPERNALTSVQLLFEALTDAHKLNNELAVEIANFSQRLSDTAYGLKRISVQGVDVDVGPYTRKKWWEAFGALAQRTQNRLTAALEGVEAIPIEGEKRPLDEKLYEAISTVRFKGLNLTSGERLWVKADDQQVVELVRSGVLQEVVEPSSGESK